MAPVTHPPRFVQQSTLGTFAQVTQGIVGLAFLLVGHEAHLRVTTSALAVSAFAVGMAVGRPLQGQLLDRVRPARVLASCGLAHGLAYLLIAVAAHEHWQLVFVACGLLIGLSLPPIATRMRSTWPQALSSSRATRMFALIATLQTVSILLGPLLFTVIDAFASATAAMLTVAGVATGCTLLFALAEPDSERDAHVPSRTQLRRYLTPLVLTALSGVVTGTIEVSAPSLALDAHHPGAAGPLVATATVGTLLGAVTAMSGLGRRLSSHTVLLVATGAQVLGSIVLFIPAPLLVTALALLVIGAGITPGYAVLSALISTRAGGTAESFGWQSTAQGLGLAGGSAVAGALIGVGGAHLSPTPALVGSVLAVVGIVLGTSAAQRPSARTVVDDATHLSQ